jgi:hypothetical protein
VASKITIEPCSQFSNYEHLVEKAFKKNSMEKRRFVSSFNRPKSPRKRSFNGSFNGSCDRCGFKGHKKSECFALVERGNRGILGSGFLSKQMAELDSLWGERKDYQLNKSRYSCPNKDFRIKMDNEKYLLGELLQEYGGTGMDENRVKKINIDWCDQTWLSSIDQ